MLTRTLSFRAESSDRRLDELQFRLILGVCFVPFLLSAAVSRVMSGVGGKINVTRRRGSILLEAWNASAIVAKTAFDG